MRGLGTLLIAAMVVVWLALWTVPASAHLTGVFAYFMQDLDEPTAGTRLLQQQLDSVSDRIAKLEPEVQRAREEYDAETSVAVKRMRFYDVYAGSAVGALWAGAQDPIDVLASTALLQKRLGEDLESLKALAQAYQRLRGTEVSLRRYADLLVPFRDASQARGERLAKAPAGLVSPFAEPAVAYRIAEDWETLRATTFVLYFAWVARQIGEQGVAEVLKPVSADKRTWQLDEEVLNALAGGDRFPFIEGARFFLRADHVNFSARLRSSRDVYNLLTVGQFERTGPSAVQYRIEAIFLDGMPLDPNDPDIQREVYRGRLMGIDVRPLLPAGASAATFEQRNGSLLFRFQ
jgi:hypothetical protein